LTSGWSVKLQENPAQAFEYLARLRDYLEAKTVLVDVLPAILMLVDDKIDVNGRAIAQPAITAIINLLETPHNLKVFKMDGAAVLTLEAIPEHQAREKLVGVLHEVNTAFAVGRGSGEALRNGISHLLPLIAALDERMNSHSVNVLGSV